MICTSMWFRGGGGEEEEHGHYYGGYILKSSKISCRVEWLSCVLYVRCGTDKRCPIQYVRIMIYLASGHSGGFFWHMRTLNQT